MSGMKHAHTSVIALVMAEISLVSLMCLMAGCNGTGNDGEEALQAITTHVVTASRQHAKIVISGKLEAWENTTLSFKIGGRIASIACDVGDSAEKDFDMAALDQAEIDARAVQARLGYEKAKRDFERVQELHDEKAATKEQLQDITTVLENARQQLNVAQYNLEHSHIRAPFNGFVTQRRHEPGEMVQAGDPVFAFISDSGEFKAKVGVAGRHVGKIATGDSAHIRLSALPRRSFAGTVSRVGSAADRMTGTFPVEIAVKGTTGVLRAGMVATVTIYVKEVHESFLIPPESLIEADEDRGYVFIYQPSDSTVHKREVLIGEVMGAEISIVGGLRAGDEIVEEGAQFLVSGDRVLARTSHQLPAATADMALSAALRSFGFLTVSQRIRLREPRSQALQPQPFLPSRDESRREVRAKHLVG